jgi:hypothetical protein
MYIHENSITLLCPKTWPDEQKRKEKKIQEKKEPGYIETSSPM